MSAYCYIIQSQKLGNFYIGACHNDLDERIANHNNTYYGKSSFTSKTNDWKLFLAFTVTSFSHAIRLERKIKAMKSSKFINNLKAFPELRMKIINETS